MQINMRSGNYRILDSGETFLFNAYDKLSLEIMDFEGFNLLIDIVFLEDRTKDQIINWQVVGDRLCVNCFNFKDDGTGTKQPVQIATVNDKVVYLSFWSYMDGSQEPKTRRVKYTFFVQENG